MDEIMINDAAADSAVEGVGQEGTEASFTETGTQEPAGTPEGAEVPKEQETVQNEPETPSDQGATGESEGDVPVRDKNAEAARRRREAERRQEAERARELEKVRLDTILDTLDRVNPYTHEPMKDETDVAEYLEMREIARRGGDPVGEYAKYHKAMERERTEAAKKEAEKNEARQRIAENRARFAADYPDVDIGTLFSDKAFLEHAGERLNTVPLSELYGEYRRAGEEAERIQNERIEARARELAAQMVANAKASPGSAVGAPAAQNGYFTREQVKAMSQREVHENYDKIKESMKHWK